MNVSASSLRGIQRLDVYRTLGNDTRCKVGVLAQNRQGVFFQYDADYLARYDNLSPFSLNSDGSLQPAPRSPHGGLHGVFADSLPDGWGLMLMDRVFRQADILPAQITAMDRLAFVGNRAMGALSYEPVSDFSQQETESVLRLEELGAQAQALFEGEAIQMLAELVRAGSSGGARPKAQLYLSDQDDDLCSTTASKGMSPYLVKFTSSQLPLGHEEGLCEAAYLTMAANAGITVPKWRLLNISESSGARHWLALERFDVTPQGGRLHLHSACGLLDADFHSSSLDYEELIKASSLLTRSPAAGQVQFRRAMFNLFSCNQDDHSKNWAFLQGDDGQWKLAPFYDVTYSPGSYGEHATAFSGHGKLPPLAVMQKLAHQANFANWTEARMVIGEVVDAIADWNEVAKGLGVCQETVRLIGRQLSEVRKENQVLLV